MPDNTNLRLQHGATLAETLVAMLLVTFSMLWGLRSATDAMTAITEALHYQRAAHIAADINELFAMIPSEHRSALPATRMHACDFAAPCDPSDWLDRHITILGERAQRSLPAGLLEFTTAETPTQPTARLSWQTHDGDTAELTWQPGV